MSVALNKYRLHLISQGLAGFEENASKRKYFKEKKEEVTQLHAFFMIKTAYISWREGFLEEIISR